MFDKKISTRIIMRHALWAALAVAIAGTVVFFASNRITKIAKSVAEKKQAAFLLEKLSESIAGLRVDLSQVGGNDARIAAALPPDDNISQFLASLEDLARQKSLQASVHVATPAATSLGNDAVAVSQIDYTLTLSGTIVTLIDYLKGFEALPYFSQIKSISIASPSGWEGNASITMQATLYAKTTSN